MTPEEERGDAPVPYNTLSLFSGAGGLDLGFRESGTMRAVACYELDDDSCETLRLNRRSLAISAEDSGPHIVQADLARADTLACLRNQDAPIDVVIGGPPCQSFSIMGKKASTRDARGQLIYSFAEVVGLLRPRAFLFENVPHFAAIEGGHIARVLRRDLERYGYSLWAGTLNAADFGALTFRTRYFILGLLGEGPAIEPPQASHTNQSQRELFGKCASAPWRTCAEVFREIEVAERQGRCLANHEVVNHSQRTVERFAGLGFGETDGVRKRNRLDPARPAHSIYVGGTIGKLQARTHIHPYLPRELTARECALIQGFPIDWEFAGRRDSVLLQVANAVPVPLARALASHIAAELCRRSPAEGMGRMPRTVLTSAPARRNRGPRIASVG